MQVSSSTALVVSALAASVPLVLARGDRIFPILALVASGLEALILFGVITFAMRPVRVDVVLPALLALAGAVSWARMSSKGLVTAATVVTFAGLIQLLVAVRALR